MRNQKIPGCRDRQQGAVLMIMVVIMILGITALLVHSLTTARVKTQQLTNTANALKQAKEALIGFAVTYAENHPSPTNPSVEGYLPCPDINGGNGEGSSQTCGSQDVNQIGRLPWRTLHLADFRDGNGECLWYAVSGNYKNNPKTAGMLNWDTKGNFQTYGSDNSLLSSDVVAVIFSPGAALTGQDRSGSAAPICGGNYTASNYLDDDTVAHGIKNSDSTAGKFIQGTDGSTTSNDQMIFITRQELWDAVQKNATFQSIMKNLTYEAASCLVKYGNNNTTCPTCNNYTLPWPSPVADITTYDDASGLYAGRIPSIVTTSVNAGGVYHNTLDPIMTSGSCGWSNFIDTWWNNWRDQFFYALAQGFRPWGNGGACGTCLKTNGTGNYAAVVLFSNNRLTSSGGANGTGQVRNSSSDKSDIRNYLENVNASNYTGANGNEDYKNAATTSSFNDILYCIQLNPSIHSLQVCDCNGSCPAATPPVITTY